MKTKGTRYELPDQILADCYRDGSIQLHRGGEVLGYPAAAFNATSDDAGLLIESHYPEGRNIGESLSAYCARVGKRVANIFG